MKTKLLVLSDNFLTGSFDFDLQDFSFYLYRKGLNLTFAHVCMFNAKVFERFLNVETAQNCEFSIVISENENLDSLISLAMPKFNQSKNLIEEQGVLLKNESSYLLFLPIESDCCKLLKETLKLIGKNKTLFGFSLFGENPKKVESFLSAKNLSCKIFEKDLVLRVIVGGDISDSLKSELSQNFKTIYSFSLESLERKVFSLLKNKNKTLSICESVTGGKIVSSLISSNPGISAHLKEGLTLYQEQAKREVLDVSDDIVQKYTCESPEMSGELAKKLLSHANTDYVLAITGDSSGEKAGFVYIAVGDKTEIHVFKVKLFGSRVEIINRASNVALYNLIKILEKA